MSSAEESVKELVGPVWYLWSPERQRLTIAKFEAAVARLAKQIESDMYDAAVKPARGELEDAAK